MKRGSSLELERITQDEKEGEEILVGMFCYIRADIVISECRPRVRVRGLLASLRLRRHYCV